MSVNLVSNVNVNIPQVARNDLRTVGDKINFFNDLAKKKVPEYPQNRITKSVQVLKRQDPEIEIRDPEIEIRDIVLPPAQALKSVSIALPKESKKEKAPLVQEKLVSAAVVKEISPHQILKRRLEDINARLNEKNALGFLRRGPFYLALAEGQFVWKRSASPVELNESEQKELHTALLSLIDALQAGTDQGIFEIRDIFPDEEEARISLHLVLEKVIARELCKDFLNNSKLRPRKMKKLRRCMTQFYYNSVFGEDIRQARAIKGCMLNCGANLHRLIETLSSLQFRSFSQDVQAIIERGRPSVLPLVSPRAGTRQEKSKKEMIDAVTNMARSKGLKERVRKEQERNFKSREDFKAFQLGWTNLDDENKAQFLNKHGLESVCNQLANDEMYPLYLKKFVLKPEKISTFNTRCILQFQESFHDCMEKLNTYLSGHETTWEKVSPNLRKFISTTGEKKEKLVELYNQRDYADCLIGIFEGIGGRNVVGNVKDMFEATVKDMVKRSLANLRASRVPEETLQELQQSWKAINESKPAAWEKLPNLITQILSEFQKLKLA